MRAKEFIIEGPIDQTPQEKRKFYRDVYAHQYIDPGDLWDDGVDCDRPDTIRNPFTAANKTKLLGAGAEAAVVKSDDENGVTKILGTYHQLSQNAHLQYLLATKKYSISNPYFPRILSISKMPNISRTNKKIQGFIIRTERLYELESASKDEINMMGAKIFGVDTGRIFDTQANLARQIKNAAMTGQYGDRIPAETVLIRGAKKFPGPIDLEFKQAVQVIVSVARKIQPTFPGGAIDLHAGNIMFRRTKFGPQLVITDPLYNGDSIPQ